MVYYAWRCIMQYNCLIVDDEQVLAHSTAEYFNLFGVSTVAVYSASDCRKFFQQNTAELILLDINLDDASGFDLCKELRQATDIPILFISARASDDDKIVAKVKAVLKRYGQATQNEYSDGYLSVNFLSKQVTVNGNAVKLTALEFKLLAYLMENKGKVISKQQLFEKVWEDKFTGDGTLNVHIRRLREAIEPNPNQPKYIVTAWGDGYKFTGDKL